jgi:hypothetical protein
MSKEEMGIGWQTFKGDNCVTDGSRSGEASAQSVDRQICFAKRCCFVEEGIG